jgi:zinc metalloprotease ZmpB
MKNIFNNDLKAELSIDDNEQVKQILHTGEYYELEKSNPQNAAVEYFQKVAGIYNLPEEQLKNMHQQVSFFEPREQSIEYRQSEEKNFFDSSTIGYFQTIHNVPVWRAGLSVTIKQNPNRVVSSVNNAQGDVELKLPDAKNIQAWKGFLLQQPSLHYTQPGFADVNVNDIQKSSGLLKEILGIKSTAASKRNVKSKEPLKENTPQFIRGRFYVYKYNKAKRQAAPPDKIADTNENEAAPILPLPVVPSSIKEGQYYLVVEITFSYGHITWLMLVEVVTHSVLYIEPLSSGVDGLVFTRDPITKSGVTTNTPNQNNATLNPFRDNITLPNLDAPVMTTQHLRGNFADIQDVTTPTIAPPTNPSGTNFNYDVRTDNFAAVNAYYHVDRFFAMVADLGFPIATYFSHTTFPIPVDHRGRVFAPGTTTHTGTGVDINAHCVGNGVDGIQHLCFLLDDLTDTANPMGIAADWRVHLHELGGHGVLYEHVGTANFGFSHSAGDSFAIIINDPDSQLRGTSDRFLLAPFVPLIVRRSDRIPATGWGWGGVNDVGGYPSEQILSSTHFRIYRSIGGDHSDPGRRQFAARMMTYLMLRTISTLTSGTNPSTALAYCNALMAVDLLNWTSEGLFGGAYNKVIRWAFEQQGLFQAPGTLSPFITPGRPPAIDVYINDGRNGEYQFQEVHWENLSIWNQRSIADPAVHAEPIIGATNYAFVKVKNRGTTDANNVTVRAYHCLPGAGLTWPTDFTEMIPTGGITLPIIHANNADEIVFGPFSWIPNSNAYGHDCILMVASQASDPSNVNNFTAGESIEEWRLVPNDNNIGQRNVYPVAGGGGLQGLVASLEGKLFYAGNPFRRTATIELKVQLPEVLSTAGWRMNFKEVTNNQFKLKPGEKRAVIINLIPGNNFTKQQIIDTADREIRILMYANNMLMGGMTYQLDPDVSKPYNGDGKQGKGECKDKAQELLQCLNISNEKVKNVCVKKVVIDIELNNDCSC